MFDILLADDHPDDVNFMRLALLDSLLITIFTPSRSTPQLTLDKI